MKSGSVQLQAFMVAAVLLVAAILVLVPLRPRETRESSLSCVFKARVIAGEPSNQAGSQRLVYYATMLAVDHRTRRRHLTDCHKMITKRYRVEFWHPGSRHRQIKTGQQLLLQLNLTGNHGLTGLQPAIEWQLLAP